MRRNTDVLLESLKDRTPHQIDKLSPKQRRRVYQLAGLRATTREDDVVEVDHKLLSRGAGMEGTKAIHRERVLSSMLCM